MGEKGYAFQFLPNAALEEAQIAFLPVAHDETVCGRRGTANGPRAIFEASGDLEYYEEDIGWSPFLHMHPHVAQELRREAGEEEADFHSRIGTVARTLCGEKRLPIILGGEHSITASATYGCFDQPGTVIVLDAHADLRPTYQGTVFSHACTMYRLREQGHRVIIVGLRSLADMEAGRLVADMDISVYWARDLETEAGRQTLLEAIRTLSGDVWLSVDMDVFDPSQVPGVGTPQPGGLAWPLVRNVLRTLFQKSSAQVRGMDLVELIPEETGRSQITGAKLVQKALSFWGAKAGYRSAPCDGAQSRISHE